MRLCDGWGGLSISEPAEQFLEFTENDVKNTKTSSEQQFSVNERGQRTMASLVEADRKATETQITRCCKSAM